MKLVYSALKQAVPKPYFSISLFTSSLHLTRDIFLIAFLLFLATFIGERFYLWPFYWFAQGTLFFALFVLGHDCGHGSFARSRAVNTIVGHICMAPLLLPFNSWRISHNAHHRNSGHAIHEDAWRPHTRQQFGQMRFYERIFRHSIFLLMAMPLYMIFGTSRRRGSHYSPACSLFTPGDRRAVIISTASVMTMLVLIAGLSAVYGTGSIMMYYCAPYLVFVMWLSGVTFLHHTDARIPWYTGREWSFLKGALSTKDRSYGIFDWFIHNTGTHVAHHLFPRIPHYNLKKTTECIKPLLEGYYCLSNKAALTDLIDTLKQCRFIESDAEGIHFYKSR